MRQLMICRRDTCFVSRAVPTDSKRTRDHVSSFAVVAFGVSSRDSPLTIDVTVFEKAETHELRTITERRGYSGGIVVVRA